MNIQQAKEILSAKQGTDSNDPLIQEALELASSHPELQDWIEEQERMDPQIASALSEVPVPEGMEEKLLQAVAPKKRVVKFAYKRAVWNFGIAALLFIGIGAVFLARNDHIVQNLQSRISGKSYSEFSSFREGMAYFVSKVYFRLDHLTEDLDSIEGWLDENQVPTFEDLPEALLALNPIGCKELLWNEAKVSLVCFHSKEGKIVHLFILPNEPQFRDGYEGITTVAQSNGLETGGWISDEKVYLLVGSDPDVDIEFALI